MEEKKGFFIKIKEMITKFFGIQQALPPAQEEILEEKKDIDSDIRKKYEVKEDIIIPNAKVNDNVQESTEESLEKMVDLIDKYDEYTFPTSLEGYSFKTDVSTNNYIHKNDVSYICYLSQDGNNEIRDSLVICDTFNKNKAFVIQKTLSKLKEKNNKSIIKEIENDGFKIDGKKPFLPEEDYHLKILLQKLFEAQQKGEETVTIPRCYLYNKDENGLSITKTIKQIEKEENETKKEIDL